MKWGRSSDWSFSAGDGRFSLSKSMVDGVPIYTLWDSRHPKGKFGQEQSVGVFEDHKDAMAVAKIRKAWSADRCADWANKNKNSGIVKTGAVMEWLDAA